MRPNILYLHSHDTGRCIQPYGYAVETPHLQRFAGEGVLFRQAFCAGPTCSPSRAAMMTGQSPHNSGMLGLVHRGGRLRNYDEHLAAFLRAHGYATAQAGMQHECPGPERGRMGYDRLLCEEAAAPAGADGEEWTARRAADFLADRHDRPFFLACGFHLTHRTGSGRQGFNGAASPLGDPRYVRPPAPLPDTPETRQDFADFRVCASRLDACMGGVLDALDRQGLASSTLVVVTTDHGIAFPFMKCNLTDHGMGVMLMMRGPRGFSGGRVVDALVSQVDVFPTVCEVAGLPLPAWLQGRSILPVVDGRATAIRDELFGEVTFHAAYEPMRAVRTRRYKYIRRFAPRPHPVLPNTDDCISKELLLAPGWRERLQAAEEFYDLLFDPNEACNRIDEGAYSEAVADLRQRLERWMHATDDPLLRGKSLPAAGYRGNPADGLSPQEPPLAACRYTTL